MTQRRRGHNLNVMSQTVAHIQKAHAAVHAAQEEIRGIDDELPGHVNLRVLTLLSEAEALLGAAERHALRTSTSNQESRIQGGVMGPVIVA